MKPEDTEIYPNRKNAVLKEGSTRIESFYQLENDEDKKKEVEQTLFEDAKSSNKKPKPFKLYKLALKDYRTESKESNILLEALSQLGPNAGFE